MPEFHDGPRSPLFHTLPFEGALTFDELARSSVSEAMKNAIPHALEGACTCWGIPFQVGKVFLLRDTPVTVAIAPTKAPWLVFMHTADLEPLEFNAHGFISPTRGQGRLNEHAADYVILYEDGVEEAHAVRRRHHIGTVQRNWGENGFECVPHAKPYPIKPLHEQLGEPPYGDLISHYGWRTTRAANVDLRPWTNWLWAWENPRPHKKIVGFRFEPRAGTIVLSGIAGGQVAAMPLRWQRRKKAVLKLPKGIAFDPALNQVGVLKQVSLDLGQVISAYPRCEYANHEWTASYEGKVPELKSDEVLVEYAAHEDARFHLDGGKTVKVSTLTEGKRVGGITSVAPSTHRVKLRVVEKGSSVPVPVRLHVHGEAGEYLAPVDRHRIPNVGWIEDYSVDFVNQNIHYATYIPGETFIDLPLSTVYIEVTKGFEIKPVRKVVKVSANTREITITLDRVLPWRARGWVTADTHVHFLSPQTALLEGAGEGVNVVNLLASQWGELMTNVGDFDGRTTIGSKETGGDGEWLVRVGTENRQHVLGHISLLGYNGSIIAPMCVGGADESAIGDPVEVLLTEWARQCRRQGGLVVMPHFPNPRAEHAATIIGGDVDAIEMASWGNLYGGIDPYSLSDWYRYLNCGYFVPAVGGTDKMLASTAVGAIRTYAHIPPDREFTYAHWMEAVKGGHTFVTYGPLLEFSVEGKPAGAWIDLKHRGGTVDVTWTAASVTMPMSRVDLVVNGEIRESKSVKSKEASGHWSVKVERSSWLALLVRGHYVDKPEVIAAHSSPVMVRVEGTPFFAPADAVTLLEQIEGALAYLDTVGTRAETKRYKEMRLVLTSAHRTLHNRLHEKGHYHEHTHATDHPEHHR